MALRPRHLRAAAFLIVAAVGVHELRSVLAVGGDADRGHGLVAVVLPLVGVVLAFALGGLLVGLARCSASHPASAVRVRRLWPIATAGLLAIYGTQELVEGLLAAGHPGGWAALVAGGGWIAVPLAVVGGGVVAVAVRVAVYVHDHTAQARQIPLAWLLRLSLPVLRAPARPDWLGVGRLIAVRLAPRGPPSPAPVI